MKIETYEDRDAWLDARTGRITGTRVKDLISKRDPSKMKKGFWEIIAERVALPPSDENVMDRGIRLEDEAVARFAKETGKKVNTDLVIWRRDENESIALSPDASIGKGKKITEAVEVKCLSSAAHIEAFITKQIPDEYVPQTRQYFVVNDDLKRLHVVFYDPRMPKPFFFLTIERKDVQKEVEEILDQERLALERMAEIEKQLTF